MTSLPDEVASETRIEGAGHGHVREGVLSGGSL